MALLTMVAMSAAATPGSSSEILGVALSRNNGVCERYVADAAHKYGVPAAVLYAVGLTESGLGGRLHPFAMNIEGETRFAGSASEALRILADARRKGARLIDLGCMQINHYYHRDQFPTDAAMLDPQRNVMYAASFLKSLKNKHKTWSMAVARYHAGPDNNAAQKRYVCRVIGNMVATGVGKWTPPAQRFCSS
ncbi:transglycosylase SLT domain-containing protein [Oricola cellulosilytica]|uniref:Lytic transglycosylase domain-containing protein n=1 Tax=Oricola cellulosilytica TaxID=1429082 RepID=A0A4R0PH72_9HYPH|nr:transglycosylase SLT domain-containing protein [Oricola cellulosilytica]TCD16213.1 lytic transglycosylase domain-containing protein [Oricola cellulosilytica]